MLETTPRSLRAPSVPAADRAPRLRRIAEPIDLQAEQCEFPSRARRLARDLRMRAAEVECGGDPDSDDDAVELLRALMG